MQIDSEKCGKEVIREGGEMGKQKYEIEKREEFREYLVKRIDQRKYDLKFFTGLFYTVAEYAKTHTLTVAKMILLSGMPKRDFYRAKTGEYDEALPMYLFKENITEDEAETVNGYPMYNGVLLLTPSEIIERLYLMLEDNLTAEMLKSKNMPEVTSRIFLHKSVFGYTDQPQVNNTTNILNISEGQLDLADKLLGGGK